MPFGRDWGRDCEVILMRAERLRISSAYELYGKDAVSLGKVYEIASLDTLRDESGFAREEDCADRCTQRLLR